MLEWWTDDGVTTTVNIILHFEQWYLYIGTWTRETIFYKNDVEILVLLCFLYSVEEKLNKQLQS